MSNVHNISPGMSPKEVLEMALEEVDNTKDLIVMAVDKEDSFILAGTFMKTDTLAWLKENFNNEVRKLICGDD